MAANYKVNIELDTSKLDAQLKDLGVKVDAVGKVRGTRSKQALTDAEKQVKAEIKSLNLENRALGVEIQSSKVKSRQIKLAQTEKLLAEAKVNAHAGDFDLATKQIALARRNVLETKKLLTQERKVTREKVKQVRVSSNINRTKSSNRIRFGGDYSSISDGKTYDASGGRASYLNYGKRGTAKFNRGAALSSATISGAFPLLFGQGPVSALGGAIGGGLGGGFGGQMGGFAGGLAGTSIATGIAAFTGSVSKLGQAINNVNKDTTPLIESLGLAGTAYEKQIKTIEALGDKEAAFELVRQKMVQQVGEEGVTALSNFGDQSKKLSQGFSVFVLNMQVGLASLIEKAGILKALSRSVETGVGMERAREMAANDPEIAGLVKQHDTIGNEGLLTNLRRSLTGKGAFSNQETKNQLLDDITALVKKRYLEKEIKMINEATNTAVQRDLDREIEVLQMSKGLSEEEFEIQNEISKLKEKDIDFDEEAYANKLRLKDELTKERDLVKEIEESYKKMTETIVNDLGEGIKGLIRGTSTLNDVLNSVLDKMIDAALNMALYGNMAGSFSKGAGFLGAIFKASGGPVKGGSPYVVGEKGPELFVPNSHGNIVPNNEMGGGANIVVNVDASGSSVEGDAGAAQELGSMLAAAIQAELVKEKRPGGLLT